VRRAENDDGHVASNWRADQLVRLLSFHEQMPLVIIGSSGEVARVICSEIGWPGPGWTWKLEGWTTQAQGSSQKNLKILHWLDIDQIWSKHQKRIANYGDALLHLTAMEI